MKLNNRESIYGFCGWLTTRNEQTVMSSADDCADIAGLIEEFSTVNNLDNVSKTWPNNLVHPSGQCSHVTESD